MHLQRCYCLFGFKNRIHQASIHLSVNKHVWLILLVVVQMMIGIIKVIIFLYIILGQVFRVAFILRVWMVCIIWAIVSGILSSYFTLLILYGWLIDISKISSILFIWMVRNIRIIKLSYWFFLHKSVMIALIFEVSKLI